MTIEEIKSKLSLLEVLNSYTFTPDKNDRLRCPWHNDKSPSLQIYPKTNTWTCFSTKCNARSGDQIDFIMKYEQITKHEALIKATQMIVGDPDASIRTTNPKLEVRPKQELSRTAMPTSKDFGRQAILTKYYQHALDSMQRGKKGKAYAESRGLDYNKLQIGYCSYEIGKTWNKDLKSNAEKLGLFKIKNCLIFPTKNKEGNIASIYGRSLSDNPNTRHFYLSGGFKGLYPSWPKSEAKQIILAESIIDASTLLSVNAATIKQNTTYEVLALYGTNGFTPDHEKAIKELESLEEIILFFDGDEAGRAAVNKYSKLLKELCAERSRSVKISHVNTPEGEDINSLIISHDPEILNHLIESRSLDTQSKKPQNQPKGKLNTDNSELIYYNTGRLLITILGGIKITGLDRLRVTLKIETKEYSHHLPVRHSLDLYHVKQVEQLTQKISESLEVGTSETERTLSHLTGALEIYRQQKLELLKPKKEEKPTMTTDEKAEAINYLKSKKLLRNTLNDINASGLVGEKNNALIAYLTYTSRKRNKPLHIMCLGASGTGKTYLQEKVSELIPEEDKIEITSLSDNAFYYFGREELKHKLILIEDLDGAENVLYPLRELQSKRRITKTVTLKDNKGNLKTITLRVEGPVCVSGCTTREKIYEDNANRCILLYIDDSDEQDKRIMHYQQRASAGNINGQAEEAIREKIKNIQRLLRPMKVVNPYAELIDLPQEVFKPRRTLLLLLSFIETITFYHQYQRPTKTNEYTGEQYIETTKEDIEAAFHLMKEALFSKSDELTKASRRFLEMLKNEVKDGEVFYTQEIRKKLRVSSSTIHRYVRELKSTGYIKYKGGNKSKGYEYQIADYQEYDNLKNNIDKKLVEIIGKINSLACSGVPVSQSCPTNQNGINNSKQINVLA